MENQKSLNDQEQTNSMEPSMSNITDIEIEMDATRFNPTTSHSSKQLIDIANNTFKELCKTLESEQQKLLELEDRRKKLQEDMLRLKKEIEDEKNAYSLELEDYDINIPDALKGKDNANAIDDDSEKSDNGDDDKDDMVKRDKLAKELKDIMKTIADEDEAQ